MAERWPSRLIFIFAAVGSAAGLGNLWRFPYMAHAYGGGAFLIPYLIALLVIGIPMLILEFALGQRFQKSAVGALRSLKKGAGTIGWWALGNGFIILSYYAVVMAWCLRYFFSSFSTAWAGDSAGFFYGTVLQLSDGISSLGGLNWTLFGCFLLVWVMIYFSVFKGVKSVSKVVTITMPLPIILIFILLLRAVTLDGAGAGLVYYVTPVFSALLDPEVWIAAAAQIFFTLTLGFGVMIAYASYTDKKQPLAADTLWTSLLNSGISIIAGFVVFGTLGFLAMQTGTLVSEVAAEGPGLAFVVFPEALSMMPMSWLFSLLFFIVLLSLGIDSAFSLIEGINAAVKERTGLPTSWVALIVAVFCLAAGVIYTTNAGLYFLDVVDNYVTKYGLVIVGILTALVTGWTKKGTAIKEHIAKQKAWFPVKTWWVLIRYVIPILLLLVLVTFFFQSQFAYSVDGVEVGFFEALKGGASMSFVIYGGYPLWTFFLGLGVVFVPLILGWFLNRWYGQKAGL